MRMLPCWGMPTGPSEIWAVGRMQEDRILLALNAACGGFASLYLARVRQHVRPIRFQTAKKGAMAKDSVTTRIHPAAWIPTMYFAEGLPFFAISLIAGILYKRLGLPNDIIALYTSWLLLPWSLKPIWSPLLEMFRTKKFFVVLFEFTSGTSLLLVALSLPMQGYFRYSLLLFALLAFSSATHDVAADGLYIASLSESQQSAFAGWQGGFFNFGRFFSQGALVILAGYLESRLDVRRAWMIIFAALRCSLLALSAYHAKMLPAGGPERGSQSLPEMARTFGDVVLSLFWNPP